MLVPRLNPRRGMADTPRAPGSIPWTVATLLAAWLVLGNGPPALAQDAAWPAFGGDTLQRGPGDYLAWYKLLPCVVLFLMWVWTTDWLNRDVHEVGDTVGLASDVWIPIVVFTFVVALLFGALTIPIFAVGCTVLVLAYLVPVMTYVLMRNARVTQDQKVLTPAHIKQCLASLGKRRGRRKEVQAAWAKGPAVDLTAHGGRTNHENQANLIQARQSPGYVTAKELLADALDKRTDKIMLDYTREGVAVRYEVDGFWHNVAPRDRESGDVLLAVMKKLSNLNMEERRARQEGEFLARYKEAKHTCRLLSQGTKTGERVLLHLEGKHEQFQTFEQLGMREKTAERLRGLIASGNGLFVLSALPAGGLTTTWTVMLRSSDRYLRDFVSVEDETKRKPYVENVEVVTFNSAAGETPDVKLPAMILKQPDVYVLPDVVNARTLDLLCREIQEEKRMAYTSVRAKEAVEAMLRLLLLKPQAEPFMKSLKAVVNQRLVRKLCETCRQAYEPSPQLLQKLGIPAGRVPVLFREYQPPPTPAKGKEPEICADCCGIGYRGRTAIFELIEVSDALRKALLEQPRLETLRQVARQSGAVSLQEEGVALMARGVTSLSELQRVMKQ